ncbi:MAG: Unknown protein [uncultured Thiotrichaceae bacterium]|uniref:Uncharacterized protein n=1 Tax=uncultured Thiotrichaceae bacterium TaxID=298394 RepID=A0A6S6TXR9_9GAMM|nr:MAG: Unknown protein [uncultured Thiotrichaceae bacterium]
MRDMGLVSLITAREGSPKLINHLNFRLQALIICSNFHKRYIQYAK